MNKNQTLVLLSALVAFAASVIFAPWELKIEKFYAGTKYSPAWIPPMHGIINTVRRERPPTRVKGSKLTPEEIAWCKENGYDPKDVYFGDPKDESVDPAVFTSVTLRTDSILIEWGAITVIGTGLWFAFRKQG
jgi:hypothetical protein